MRCVGAIGVGEGAGSLAAWSKVGKGRRGDMGSVGVRREVMKREYDGRSKVCAAPWG